MSSEMMYAAIAVAAVLGILLIWIICEFIYYRTGKFNSIKAGLEGEVKHCNMMTEAANNLVKAVHAEAEYFGGMENEYSCTDKYLKSIDMVYAHICMQFGIPMNAETVARLKALLSDVELIDEMKGVISKSQGTALKKLPLLIRVNNKEALKKLQFTELTEDSYIINYKMHGEKLVLECRMDAENIKKCIAFLENVDGINRKNMEFREKAHAECENLLRGSEINEPEQKAGGEGSD